MPSKSSFTSADALPIKLIQDFNLVESIVTDGRILPIHAQVIPTNECNLKCSFCSCSEEDRSLAMDYNDVIHVMRVLQRLGTQAITITGGGEPTMSPHLGTLIFEAYRKNIQVGLVTNGIRLGSLNSETINRLTWCRVSCGDANKLTPRNEAYLAALMLEHNKVDWALSYVVSDKPNLEQIEVAIKLANTANCTHLRLVADLMNPEYVPMDRVYMEFKGQIDNSRVPIILQGRNRPEMGENCRIGYLKPVISPDLKVYACCGVQYALAERSRKLPDELCMGTLTDYARMIENSDTSPLLNAKMCVRCYYGDYNRVLDALVTRVDHKRFV